MNKQWYYRLVLACLLPLTLSSCASMGSFISTSGMLSQPLTDGEIGSGLKEALNVGIRNGVQDLIRTDGYFANEAIKILLPPEAQKVQNIITQYIPGGQNLINEAVLKMNRAAEDAAQEALPIFADAITSMSIQDARGILFGERNAATAYLRSRTYDNLRGQYAPKINNSLSSVGATQAWEALTTPYNKFANSAAARLIDGVSPVNSDLGAYVTERALDGLFFKVQQEEDKIRTNVNARVSDLLRRVFGELDK
ncbi:DUF4197 domain-containing protein [Eisenibacter elegans]|jgi:hypothetical protein|uniref:DUF4197 domain-containing protein n=1 Tax=Eisenibacter elegans TaxID=997 RepID=UPI0004113F9E|nr:DUF4197 domain-containing protein [Eisenibacter elegans]